MNKIRELLKQPKTHQVTVTTVQDMLIAAYGNQTTVNELLNIHKSTLATMIKDNRPNHVLIRENGSYKLLK